MLRRLKCFLLASCVLALLATMFFQLHGQGMHVQIWHRCPDPAEELKPNVSRESSQVLLFPAVHSKDNPVPPDTVLQQMSHKDVQSFYHGYVNGPQVACSRVERMGKLTDGGWELCDDPLYRPSSGDCLVYSYGINFDFSYDDDMAKYGCEIHAFDPSMKMGPHLHNPLVYFHSSGVGGKNETIAPKGELWQLYTISSHRKMLQHTPEQRRLDIVKMDVEGHELDSLMTALDDGSLSDVQQLVFETHVGWGNYDPPKDEYMKPFGSKPNSGCLTLQIILNPIHVFF